MAGHLRVGSFQRHLASRLHKKKGIKRILVAGLMLTSMVDMFSLLVIFLLQSFSNSPEIMALSKGVQLPSAMSASAAIDAPVLSISNEEVHLDQKLVGPTEALLKNPQALLTKLQEMRNVWQSAHPQDAFTGDIHLQADRQFPSTFVSQFISMLISQGYSSVHLAVATGKN
jgi:biopolymer transport protein ExbD